MIPKYFTLAELLVTNTGLKNIPGWEEIENLKYLAGKLDVIRSSFGKPIRVNSAFRSPEVNAASSGSSKTSAHLHGLAADICAYSGTESENRRLLKMLENGISQIDQLISYHKVAGDVATPIRFIHVGFRRDGFEPRCQRMTK